LDSNERAVVRILRHIRLTIVDDKFKSKLTKKHFCQCFIRFVRFWKKGDLEQNKANSWNKTISVTKKKYSSGPSYQFDLQKQEE